MAVSKIGRGVYVINVEGRTRSKDYSGLVSTERHRLWQENLAFEQQRMEAEKASYEQKEAARQKRLSELNKEISDLKARRLDPAFSLGDLRQTTSGPTVSDSATTGPAVKVEQRGAREDINPWTGEPEIKGEQTVVKTEGVQLQGPGGELLYRTPTGELTVQDTGIPAMDPTAAPKRTTGRGSWSGVSAKDRERFFAERQRIDEEREAQIRALEEERLGYVDPTEMYDGDLQARARRSYAENYGVGGLYGAPNIGLGAGVSKAIQDRRAEMELLDAEEEREASARRGQRAIDAGDRQRDRARAQYDRAVGAYDRALDYDEAGAERIQDAARDRMIRKGLNLPISPESTIDYGEPVEAPIGVGPSALEATAKFEEGGYEYEAAPGGGYYATKDGRTVLAEPGTVAAESIGRVRRGEAPLPPRRRADFEALDAPVPAPVVDPYAAPPAADFEPAGPPMPAQQIPDDMDLTEEPGGIVEPVEVKDTRTDEDIDFSDLDEMIYGEEGRKSDFDKREESKDKYAADTMKAGKKLAAKPEKLARIAKRNLPERQRRKEAPRYVTVVDDILKVYRNDEQGFRKAYDKITDLFQQDATERKKAHEYLVATTFLEADNKEPMA